MAKAVGLDPNDLIGGPSDISIIIKTARRVGHVLGYLEEEQAERMLRLGKHYTSLLQSFRPGRFNGDLLLFPAAEHRLHLFSPGLWEPYITGHVEVHWIQCRYSQITDRFLLLRSVACWSSDGKVPTLINLTGIRRCLSMRECPGYFPAF